MYVIVHRYKIRKKDLPKWRKIMKESGRILKKHGETGQYIELFKRGKTLVTIMQCIYHDTKKHHLEVSKRAHKDPAMLKYYEAFGKILYGKITDEIFDTK